MVTNCISVAFMQHGSGTIDMARSFHDRLLLRKPILLDGATGTELSRRGVDLSGESWTASAIRQHPQLLQDIHTDYARAGAEVLTANTFRTHPSSLRCLGLESEAAALTREAVELARSASDECWIAGSIAPIGDCYSPNQTPDSATLHHEHSTMVDNLVAADVDLILIETQLTIREAVLVCSLTADVGCPVLVSFVTTASGTLLSGESLEDAVSAVMEYSPTAILINCVSPTSAAQTLQRLKSTDPSAFGIYANTGTLLIDGTWEATGAENPAVYAEFAQAWIDLEIDLIGGCCGTTPEHVSRLPRMVCDF